MTKPHARKPLPQGPENTVAVTAEQLYNATRQLAERLIGINGLFWLRAFFKFLRMEASIFLHYRVIKEDVAKVPHVSIGGGEQFVKTDCLDLINSAEISHHVQGPAPWYHIHEENFVGWENYWHEINPEASGPKKYDIVLTTPEDLWSPKELEKASRDLAQRPHVAAIEQILRHRFWPILPIAALGCIPELVELALCPTPGYLTSFIFMLPSTTMISTLPDERTLMLDVWSGSNGSQRDPFWSALSQSGLEFFLRGKRSNPFHRVYLVIGKSVK